MIIKEQLKGLIDKNWDCLPTLWKEYGKKRKEIESELDESIKDLTRSEQEQLWQNIFDFFSTHFLTKMFDKETLEDGDMSGNSEDNEKDFETVLGIFLLTSIQIDALITQKQYHEPPQKLFQFVVLLGGMLSEFEDDIQRYAVIICEKWVLNDLEGKSEICSKTLLTLIKISLESNSKKQNVKRVWALNAGLSYLSFTNNDDAHLPIGKLLLSCVSSPNYLSCDEGIKFISSVFSIPSLTKEVHKIVKNKLPEVTRAQSVKYSELYFRTWKNCEGEQKRKFEEDCIQDMMHFAIHCDPLVTKLSGNMNTFLHHFHKHKKHAPTASVIYRLYEPFLWRSLNVANGYVRLNATRILCDAFPFTVMNASQEEKEELMEQQYQAILDLLVDDCHLVRIQAIKGVFSVLSDYWLMIPCHIIKKIFQIFINKLIVDASTPEVRAEVVTGFTRLLDCSDAGPFIMEVLPRISESFDDINPSVRISFIKLLLKVKTTNFIKYWKLVPIEHLLIRMAEDVLNVSVLISHLLQASFLPIHLDEQELFQRCISLVEMNRLAARRFYHYSSKNLDLETTTKFILFIWRQLYKYVLASQSTNSFSSSFEDSFESSVGTPNLRTKEKRKSPRVVKGSNKENNVPELVNSTLGTNAKGNIIEPDKSSDQSHLPLDDPNVVGGLLDIIIILWSVKAPILAQAANLKYLEALRSRISHTFPSIWTFFKESEEIPRTLLFLSSFLPSSMMPTMVGLCLSRLRALSATSSSCSSEEQFSIYINALCNWNRIDDIVEIISEWLTAVFDSVIQDSSTQKQISKKSKVCFQEKTIPNPLLALRFLRCILEHPLNKTCLVQRNRQLLLNLCELMSKVKQLICLRAKNDGEISSLCSDEFILLCWKEYLIIIIISDSSKENRENATNNDVRRSSRGKTNESKSSSEEEIEHFEGAKIQIENIDFMFKTFLNEDMNGRSYRNTSFMFKCLLEMLKVGRLSMCCNTANIIFATSYLDYIKQLITLFSKGMGKSYFVDFICQGLDGIGATHRYILAFGDDESLLTTTTSVTENTLKQFITFIVHTEYEELNVKEMHLINESLEKCISVIIEYSDDLCDSICKHILKEILSVLNEDLKNNPGTVPDLTKVSDLPGGSKIMVMTACKKVSLSQSFGEALKYLFTIDSSPGIDDILSGSLLLSVMVNDKGKISQNILKSIAMEASELINRTQEPSVDINNSTSSADGADQGEFLRFCYLKSRELIKNVANSLGILQE